VYARLIVNPAAGAGGTARKWPFINSLLKNIGLRFEHDVTEAPGHAIELAKSAVKNGYETVISVGGDGTINEVVNGLFDSGSIKEVNMGIIGTGTGGDYIRTIGVSHNYKEACHHLLSPETIVVDLGMVEQEDDNKHKKRLFANFAGLGFDAEIVRATTQKFKRFGSVPSYLMGIFSTLLCYRNKNISLTLDGIREERKVCSVVMSNGKYGGGSMFIAPEADLEDGLFDVLIINDISKLDLLWSLPRIYKGTHLTHPKITLKRARTVEIQTEEAMTVQADGELIGKSPATFRVLPATLNILR